MNKNKTIQMYQNKNDYDTSWRTNLSRILNKLQDANPIISNINSFSQWDVPKSVELCINDQGYPTLSTNNGYDEAYKSAMDITKKVPLVGGLLHDIVNGGMNLAAAAYNIGTAINAEGSEPSGMFNPWFEHAPVWTGAKGSQNIKYKFEFSMGQFGLWNAREEVFNPIVNLMAPTMPRMLSGYSMTPPSPNQYQVYKKVFEDLFDKKDFESDGENGFDSFFENLSKNSLSLYDEYTFNVEFGNFISFHNMLIKDSLAINFSQDTDQDGYPISGSIELEMTNIIPPALSAKGNGRTSFEFKVK